MYKKVSLVSLALASCFGVRAEYFEMPTESGFSGDIAIGLSHSNGKGNFYKGSFDNKQIVDLGDADSFESKASAFAFANLSYTFADTRTQLFLGNIAEDVIRYDFAQQFGIRQEIGKAGTLSAGLVFAGLMNEVWQDPYAIGQDRKETDRDSNGFRFAWHNIYQSNFSVATTMREVEIDREGSGLFWAGKVINGREIEANELNALNRNGDLLDMEISYDFFLAENQILTTEVSYRDADLDGKAEAYQRARLLLTYTFFSHDWTFVGNLGASQSDFDEVNPILGKESDSNEFLIGGAFYKDALFNISWLNPFIAMTYAKSDSDNDFRDGEVFNVSTGLIYRF